MTCYTFLVVFKAMHTYRSHWNTNFRSWNEWNYCINRILESQEIQMNSVEARL